MQLMNVVKPGVKPNPTLKIATQFTMGVALQWFRFGPWLGESSHLKVCLEGHVTLLHFKDVKIFIDII
jgi:hypothetical protein